MADDSLFSLLAVIWFGMPVVIIALGFFVSVGWATAALIKGLSHTTKTNKTNPE
jgi:hypothetical protein